MVLLLKLCVLELNTVLKLNLCFGAKSIRGNERKLLVFCLVVVSNYPAEYPALAG